MSHGHLKQARAQLMKEFVFKETVLAQIENLLAQEPHCMVRSSDGQSKPSTKWSRTIEQLWTMNNGKTTDKGRQMYSDSMSVEGQTFSRRKFMLEPIFRTDLLNLLRKQFSGLGYSRCYVKDVFRTDYNTGEEYKTLMVQVPV